MSATSFPASGSRVTTMDDFLALMGSIVRTYCTHHAPEMFDDPHEVDITWFNHIVGGWWILRDDMGWAWWLGVYTRCPAGQDLDQFWGCQLDAPLPRATFGADT